MLEVARAKHPYIIGVVERIFANKENRFGLQITDDHTVVGEYTIHTKGIHIVETETGKLDSAFKHPLIDVIIKPYAIIEKAALEQIIDDRGIMDEPFEALVRFLPNITIKFMK